MADILLNYSKFMKCLHAFCSEFKYKTPLVVAVSKSNPLSAVKQLYDLGHRDFGENTLPNDIKWHFIGHLQTNKCSALLKIKNLFVIQTLDSIKLSKKLESLCFSLKKYFVFFKGISLDIKSLNVFIQINTSCEKSKNGVSEEGLNDLAEFVIQKCPHLYIKGLMTIGLAGDKSSFAKIKAMRDVVCARYGWVQDDVALSIGMSGDFQSAIENGANIIRIGESIFGLRKE